MMTELTQSIERLRVKVGSWVVVKQLVLPSTFLEMVQKKMKLLQLASLHPMACHSLLKLSH